MTNLKTQKVWVNWIYFTDPAEPDKPKKIPKNPRNGYPAKVNDPTTWGSFELAQSKVGTTITHRHFLKDGSGQYQDYQCKIEDIGFMFAEGISGIDIDNKNNDPETDVRAADIINLMNTYTEYSPSGKGYHLIFKCDMSKLPTFKTDKALKLDSAYYQKNPYNGVECYFSGVTNRFFTYTGEAINNLAIEDRTGEVLQFLDKYMRKSPEPSTTEAGDSTNHVHNNLNDIINIARKAKNFNKFSKLFYQGNKSDYNNDDSAADMALCGILAFYCRGDFNTIDNLFRQSALYRQKWERNDYRTDTINKAIALCGGEFYTPPGRPKKEKADTDSKNDKPKYLTVERLQEFMQDSGVSFKYNVITRLADIKGLEEKYSLEHLQNALPLILTENINNSGLYKKRTNKDIVLDLLTITLSQNDRQYNPVLEMLESATWDGVDRLPELYNILNIKEDDTLSKTLIFKWLWQCLSMVRNQLDGAYGAEGVLTLQGKQRMGKTSFFKKLATKLDFFYEGARLNFDDKDTLRRATSYWIVELGEIETTFKSDVEALKSFITDPIDQYRLPYGRTDVRLARRASMCGTCNSNEFLIDTTGNLRFWTVPVTNIDLDALAKFDALQLWLQIDIISTDNIQGFRLTKDEQTALAERNGQHEKLLKGEFEIKDIIEKLSTDSRYFEKEVTVTEFKMANKALDKYSSEQIGKVLDKLGIEAEHTKIKGKKVRLRKLPMLGEDFLKPENR